MRPEAAEAMLDHFAHLAEESADEAQAMRALQRLAPLLGALVARSARPAVRQAAPALRRAVRGTGRMLWVNPSTRPLIATLPAVIRHTATAIRRRAAQQPVVRADVLAALRNAFNRVYASPRTAAAISHHVHHRGCRHCGARNANVIPNVSPNVIRKFVATSVPAHSHVHSHVHSHSHSHSDSRPCGCRHFGP